MKIRIIREPVSLEEVLELAKESYGDMVKGVADVDKEIIALGGEWHMDANNELIRAGSQQKNLWGFNLYPNEKEDTAVEYISLINIRPTQGNREMELKDEKTRSAMLQIIKRLVPDLFV